MPLATGVSALATRIGTEFKTVKASVGVLGNLSTTVKSDLVGAINELAQRPTGAIADGAVGTSTTYSSDKITSLNAAQDLVISGKAASSHTHTLANITDAATKADLSAVVTLTGAQSVAGIKTFTSAPVVPANSFAIAAISGLQTALNAKTQILDTAPATDTGNTWSAKKTNDTIVAAISALTTGAPGLLDTLDELAAAIGDDANFAATMTTALAGRLKVDGTAQTIIAANQAIAIANLGAVSATAVGNTETNFVTVFEAALV